MKPLERFLDEQEIESIFINIEVWEQIMYRFTFRYYLCLYVLFVCVRKPRI